MEYVVQAFKVLKNLVHAEANARAQQLEHEICKLIPKGAFVIIITERPLGISLQISCSN